MTTINWLHLTDLHCGMQDQDWMLPGVREPFFEDLERLYSKCGPWDLVLFTGDLTQQGTQQEFARLDKFLAKLWKKFEDLGCKPVLLAVPGNHDLVRPDPADPIVSALETVHTNSTVQQAFWGKKREYNRPVRKLIY